MSTPPASNQPRPPSRPPTSADQKTIVSNLNPASVTDPTRVVGPAADSLLTRQPGAATPRSPGETMSTELHVDGGKGQGKTTSGTHQHEIWGDFQLGALLGRGGMGAVYLGKQVSLDRPVAIKVLPAHLSENDNFKTRFQLEAKAVAQLNSPHVIQVYAAGQHQGHHYFAMEYVEGEDLSRRLKNGYRPSYRETINLIIQGAKGLVAAGEHGIIHRDIKPANMMITAKGVLKLMDFGLVRVARAEETGLTMAGTIMGTVSYFSPEQGRGERCDCRTDIYALGVVFYELLTGKLPFTGGDATSVIYQHIHQPPKPPKEIDPEIPEYYQAVVLKCLQKDPANRYQTAAEMLADLEAVAAGIAPSTAYMDPRGLRVGGVLVKHGAFNAERRSGTGWLVAALVLVVASGGGAWWVIQNQQTKPPDVPKPSVAVPVSPLVPSTTVVVVQPADPVPVPPAVPVQPPGRSDLEQAKLLFQAGNFAETRRLVDLNRQAKPNDAAWTVLGGELDQAQGTADLKLAQAALAAGELESSAKALASARTRLGEVPAVADFAKQLAGRDQARLTRQRQLEEAENLMVEGNAARAETMLTAMLSATPGDSAVEGALRRAKKLREDQDARSKAVAERVQQGELALGRKDLDAALLHFTAAQQLEPKNPRATAGLDAVTKGKSQLTALRERFELALKDKDLAAAEQQIAAMRQLAPGSPTLVLAENELGNSKLSEQTKAKAAADQETAIVAQAKALSALIDDPTQQIPAVEQALAGFIERSGADRPERKMLETKLEDRRQRTVLTQSLAGLDAALTRKDAIAIKAAVSDATFAQDLIALTGYEGLVFESRLADFVRKERTATATVQVRHALKIFPERTLTLAYQLANTEGKGWIITSAKLVGP